MGNIFQKMCFCRTNCPQSSETSKRSVYRIDDIFFVPRWMDYVLLSVIGTGYTTCYSTRLHCTTWWHLSYYLHAIQKKWKEITRYEKLKCGLWFGVCTVKSLIWGAPNLNTWKILVLSCGCLCRIPWSQMLSREWRCSWSSADRRCSNYIWVIDNVIAC